MASTKSRTLGCIWGNCIGDALGGPVQFKLKGTFRPVTGLRIVETFDQPAGSYSDDGSMTLALSQSFIDSKGTYNHAGSIKYFVEWFRSGRFSTTDWAWDIGTSTRIALSIWKKDGEKDPEKAQRQINEQLDKEGCSGNGSLMRISPVGLAMWKDPVEAGKRAREQSTVTHPALACLEACALYTELLCLVMAGKTKETLSQAICTFDLTHPALSARMNKYQSGLSSWQRRLQSDMKSSGWVVDTLEVALWGFFKYDSWMEGALAVVNLGGDADTAGAVYGALAGAFYGFEGLPVECVEGMQMKDLIGSIAEGMAMLVV